MTWRALFSASSVSLRRSNVFLSNLGISQHHFYIASRNLSFAKRSRTQWCAVYGRHSIGQFLNHRESLLLNGRWAGCSQSVRWSSGSVAGDTELGASVQVIDTPNLPPGYIPEPPVPPPVEEVIPQLTALGEPTLHSLGLGSWWPPGLVQNGLEALHVGFDMPWWTSIVVGTFILRLLMSPLVIFAQRNAANMHNHMPIIQKLQNKYERAKNSGNMIEAATAANNLVDYMKKNNYNPMRSAAMPFAQLPIFVSVFIGIRKMANLPVESLQTGGVAWFTDLTIPDPFYILPLLTMTTFLVTLELGVDGVRAASMSKTMRNTMRVVPFVLLPFTINFPSALLCYWLTANVFSLGQVLILKIPEVRTYCGIPKLVVHEKTVSEEMKKPFVKRMKQVWKDAKKTSSVDELQRREATQFKEAGMGAIPRTYSYDPTKVPPKTYVRTKTK